MLAAAPRPRRTPQDVAWAASARKSHWYRARTSVEPGWIAGRFARRDLQVIGTAERSEPPADRFSQVDLPRTFSRDGAADDVPGLGLHRMAMLSGPDAQPLLHRRVEV